MLRPSRPRPLRILLDAFARSRRGGVAAIFGLSVPILAVIGCGAVDLASVNAERTKMQDVADAAALDGAKQLSVANAKGVTTRTEDYATAQLTDVAKQVTLTTKATVAANNASITITIKGHRQSFFGNLLPVGGWNFNAAATAEPVGQTPLCVLAIASSGAGDAINMQDQSRTTATGCLVHSNSDMNVPSPANLAAGTAEAVGAASGQISPTPQTGAPPIADPFSSLNLNMPVLCDVLDLVYDLGVNTITTTALTSHCGTMIVRKNATVILQPGVHYFRNGGLVLQDNATLQGTNVTLVFDSKSSFTFQDHSQINLQGRQTGAFAGFVIATTPANTNTFSISSDAAHVLLGTIYVPNAQLVVSGGSTNVADQSAWTVIIAKGLLLSGSPNLVINSNYAGSSVPVPSGVGPVSQGARLVK